VKSDKGRPFLEIFGLSLSEDYRFPFLEIFCFLYAIGTFAFVSSVSSSVVRGTSSGETVAYNLASLTLGFPLFIFVILILKNLAYGLGSDLERGIFQTLLSYPARRNSILTAKLLSGVGFAVLPFVGIQISALYILAPSVVGPNLPIVLLAFAANLSEPLLLAGIVLLMTLVIKRGALALVTGLILYFGVTNAGLLALFAASGTTPIIGLDILSTINPNLAASRYYSLYSNNTQAGTLLWAPSFGDVLLFLGAGYLIVFSLFLINYLYFSRRFSL